MTFRRCLLVALEIASAGLLGCLGLAVVQTEFFIAVYAVTMAFVVAGILALAK